MASDITEKFQVDITNQSTSTVVAENSGITYDVSFNNNGFFDASSANSPYRRQTAQYRKDQNDNSAEPGEQTLLGWWLRSQSSFHYGAGIEFYEPAQEQGYAQNLTLRYRFADSQGLNVWTPGRVTLLKDVDAGHYVTSTGNTMLRAIKWGTTNGVLMNDGEDVDKLIPDYPDFKATAKKVVSNVATITVPTNPSFAVGDLLSVGDVDSTFNGVYTVTAVSTLTSATPTATGSAAATTISVSSATNIVIGMGVSGTGIASGAYVRSISGTTITLSVANTDAVSGTVTFVGYTFSYSKTTGNVSNTSVYPAGYASKGVIHFIDYNGGGSNAVKTICDDGTNAYWISNLSSPLKWTVTKKPLSGSAASTADETQLYQDAGSCSEAVMEYVKGRLIAGVDNNLIEITTAGVTSTKYTAPDTNTRFTAITESGSDIYAAMVNGIQSQIMKLTVTDTGTIASLSGAVTVATMPRGEIIYGMRYYLGYLMIGTSRGVRVAQVQSDGSIVYGPLLFEASQPVYQFAFNDHFAYCTAQIGGDAGLVRIDLGAQIDTLVFPYANDLQAVGSSKACSGVAFVGETNRLAFTSAGGYSYIESATVLRSNGYLKAGKIRYNTLEDKYFKYIKERADYSNGGSIGIATTTASITTVDATTGNHDIGITETNATDNRQFIFTLNRNSSDSTKGPVFYGYQIKALPAVKRQRLVQYNLYCFDKEQDRYGNFNGYNGRAYERLALFEQLEETADIVTVKDYRTGETFQALIEECSFTGVTAPHKNFNGFGGVLTVTVRKI